MKKEDLEKILAESESVKEAVDSGVPLKDAATIYSTANKFVETGKWVQLCTTTSNESEKIEQGTSLMRYWGPKTLLKSADGKDGVSVSKAERLFKQGLVGKTYESVGKTHELARGSDIFNEHKAGISEPALGSKVYHRHWEIKEMYHYAKKRLNKHLLGFFFSISSLMFVFFFLQTPSITGSAVIKTSKIDTTFFVFILSGISVVLLILLLFKKRINFMKGRL